MRQSNLWGEDEGERDGEKGSRREREKAREYERVGSDGRMMET